MDFKVINTDPQINHFDLVVDIQGLAEVNNLEERRQQVSLITSTQRGNYRYNIDSGFDKINSFEVSTQIITRNLFTALSKVDGFLSIDPIKQIEFKDRNAEKVKSIEYNIKFNDFELTENIVL